MLKRLLPATLALLLCSAAQAGVTTTGGGKLPGSVQASLFWDTVTGAAHSDVKISFSNGNRDSTNNTGGEVGARALLPQSGAFKSCVEFTVVTPAPTPILGIGLAGASYDSSNYLGSNGDSVAAFSGDTTYRTGVFTVNDSTAWSTINGAPIAGDTITICADGGTGKAFIGRAASGAGSITWGGTQNISTEAAPWVLFTAGTTVTFAADQKNGNATLLRFNASPVYSYPGWTVLNH